eukprot:2719785-Amphidinium_carterae.1
MPELSHKVGCLSPMEVSACSRDIQRKSTCSFTPRVTSKMIRKHALRLTSTCEDATSFKS